MALTRDFKQTIVERVRRDPEFARALLDEAATLFLNNDPETARLILRDLVNATVGFEELAALTAKPAKSLHRMLSKNGNPTMDNLAAILGVVRTKLGVDIQVHIVAAAKGPAVIFSLVPISHLANYIEKYGTPPLVRSGAESWRKLRRPESTSIK